MPKNLGTAAFLAHLEGKGEGFNVAAHFVRVPLPWLAAAAAAGTAALRAGLLIWYFPNMAVCNRAPSWSYARLARLLPLGFKASTLASGVKALKKAGLVDTVQLKGRGIRIDLNSDAELMNRLADDYWTLVDKQQGRAPRKKASTKKRPISHEPLLRTPTRAQVLSKAKRCKAAKGKRKR